MGVKVHTIPIDPVTRQVNIKRVARAMYVFFSLSPGWTRTEYFTAFSNPNTIMVTGLSLYFMGALTFFEGRRILRQLSRR